MSTPEFELYSKAYDDFQVDDHMWHLRRVQKSGGRFLAKIGSGLKINGKSELIFKRSPTAIAYYARHSHGARLPWLESVIATHSWASLYYARHVLKRRFLAFEEFRRHIASYEGVPGANRVSDRYILMLQHEFQDEFHEFLMERGDWRPA